MIQYQSELPFLGERSLRIIERDRIYNSTYRRERAKVDPEFKLAQTIRSRISGALRGKVKKSASSMVLLGCDDISIARKHIEAQFKDGMTWENHGKVWHIDHIKPCAAFNLMIPQEQKDCFNYKNLCPLLAQENLQKSSIYKGKRHSKPYKTKKPKDEVEGGEEVEEISYEI